MLQSMACNWELGNEGSNFILAEEHVFTMSEHESFTQNFDGKLDRTLAGMKLPTCFQVLNYISYFAKKLASL